MIKNNEKIIFYENLFIIDWFWIILSMTVTVAFTIYSLITKQLFFVIFIVLGSSVLIVLLCHLLATIFLRKITIDATGISIKTIKKNQVYLWKDIEFITLEAEAIETGELITTILLLIFKFRFCYLKVSTYTQQYIKPITVQKKHKQLIGRFYNA